MRTWSLVARAALLAMIAAPAAARAQLHVDDARLALMHEPIAYTDVLDAFDGDDPFDIGVQLAYERTRDRASVYREITVVDDAGEAARKQLRVARADRELSRLAIGAEVGLLPDLAAFVRLPLILADARALRARGDRRVVTAALDDGEGGALFTPPYGSASRAGLDYLALGVAWSILNQNRKPWHGTWVLRVEGRRGFTAPVRPCQSVEGADRCGSSSRDDRDGDDARDGTAVEGGGAGSSEGLSALLVETRFSRRYRRAEPYAGFSVLTSWPARASRSFAGGRGGRPGPEASATFGAALIPWEDRGRFQRLVLDLRVDATYVARGLGYGALYDALGTSSSPALATPRYPAGACVEGVCSPRDAAVFRGVTEIDAHLRYGGQLGLEVQAARYVRFAVGTSLHAVSAHALTGREACSSGRLSGDGSCAGGSFDPGYRAAIDAPGRRFFLRDALQLGGYAQATAMF